MFRKALIILAAIAISGCAMRDATLTRLCIETSKGTEACLVSHKDVSMDTVNITAPGGYSFNMTGYSSNANAEAMRVIADAQREQREALIEAVKSGVQTGLNMAADAAMPAL